MKKTTTVLLGILFSLSLFSQSDKHHEISLNYDDIFAKTDNNPIYFYDQYNNLIYVQSISSIPKVGIGYKYNFSNGAIRSRFMIGSSNNKSEDRSYPSTYETNLLNLTIALGYEYHMNIEKTQIFFGSDIYTGYLKNTTISTYTSGISPSATIKSTRLSETLSYGISPLIGVKYFITPALSISTEMRFMIDFREETNSSTGTSGSTTLGTKENGFETRFGPLGQISLNLHF